MDVDADDRDAHMNRASKIGEEAAERGDDPFGSVLVRDGEIWMEESNRIQTEDDLTLHPELTLARRAAIELSESESSGEPYSDLGLCEKDVILSGIS